MLTGLKRSAAILAAAGCMHCGPLGDFGANGSVAAAAAWKAARR